MLCYELLIEASFALLKNISIIFDVCLIKVLIVSPTSASCIKMILDVNTNTKRAISLSYCNCYLKQREYDELSKTTLFQTLS